MGFTYCTCKCTTHFHGSSRIRSSDMVRENGTDHCNVVDKVSLPRRPEFDFARNLIWCGNFIMLRVYLCFCNTESKSFGRCCMLDRSKAKKIKYLPFLLILINNQLDANSFYIHLFRSSTCFEQSCAHRQTCIPDGQLHRVTCTRCCNDTIDYPDDEHKIVRNV